MKYLLFFCSILLVGASLFAAPDPLAVQPAHIRSALTALPPHGQRLFCNFQTWTPDRAKDSFSFAAARNITLKNAERFLQAPLVEYKKEGVRLLGPCNQVLTRVINLAIAYKLTGEEKYLQRGIREIMNGAAFPDWNPRHFLDTATMSFAIAIGHDWYYDRLTPEQRKSLRRALTDKGLKPAAAPETSHWSTSINNWNQVCSGGIAAAALVCAEEEPELAAKLLARSLNNLPRTMKISYAPNGGFPEGASYWGYGTSYNCIFIALLKHALGTDYGLSDQPGWNKTGSYVSSAYTPAGAIWHYADGQNESVPGFAHFYLDHEYPGSIYFFPQMRRRLEWYSRQADKREVSSHLIELSMLFMHADTGKSPAPAPWYWSGKNANLPIFICRTAWQPDALYFAIKGGSARLSHAHMDAGSFVIESEGQYFVQEVGNERYINIEKTGRNLWSQEQNSDRWKLTRYGIYGHSIPRINDDQQHVDGFADFTQIATDPEKSSYQVTLDLSSLYPKAKTVTRSAAFTPEKIVITDRFSGVKPDSKITFQFISRAQIEVLDKTELLMTLKEKKMRVSVDGISDICWRHPLLDERRQDYEAQNGTAQEVAFTVPASQSGEVQYSVTFTPVR